MNIIYVALGGALGSVARYLMQSVIGKNWGSSFPYGTIIVNISGSLLMGILIGWLSRTMPERAQDLRIFLAVGVLGGYTTFSSFSLDAIVLMEEGRWVAMSIYVLASVLCGLIGLMAGLQVMRTFA
jgi:CrcB protein